ncbi:hypothetical protein BY996DRAFT_2579499 [Phakopsora pachyrhizi]|nr:hypothetical protein BY996DRAFT_2579499 [Phakopsora pachyrhizi]
MRLLLKLCCFLTFFCNWGSTRQCLRLFQKIDSPNEICIVENANDLSFNPTNESGSFAKLLKSPKQMSCIPTSSTRSKKVKKSSAKKNPDIINYFESQGEWLESQKEIDNLNSRKPKTKAKDLRSKSEKSKEKISDISKNLVVDRNSRSLPPKKSPPLGAKAIKSKSLPHLSKYSFAEAYEALYLTDSPRRPKILPLNSHIAQPKTKVFPHQ